MGLCLWGVWCRVCLGFRAIGFDAEVGMLQVSSFQQQATTTAHPSWELAQQPNIEAQMITSTIPEGFLLCLYDTGAQRHSLSVRAAALASPFLPRVHKPTPQGPRRQTPQSGPESTKPQALNG